MDIIAFNGNYCKIFFFFLTLSAVIFAGLLNIFEPYLPVIFTETLRYGKFACNKSSFLSKYVTLPKSYFRHFYLTSTFIYYPIAVSEVVSVYVYDNDVSEWLKNGLDLLCGTERKATVTTTRIFIAVILLMFQVSRRFYESHFVSVFSKNATINVIQYILAMVYYPALVVIILSEAPKFAQFDYSQSRLQLQDIGLREILAIGLFLWASYHQHLAAVILANLRKNDKGEVVSQSYKLPQGDWFKYVSSLHSTAEILIYTALTLLLINNETWCCIYGFVLINQTETILLSHWWYQEHFKNFPKDRKALIPFLY